MITELKSEIEKKIGKKVISRGDCELVSLAIQEMIDETISYNTIRRLFGLSPFVKPNKNTLNILSRFIGYKNYYDFTDNYEFKERTKLLKSTYVYLFEENEKKILELVISAKKRHEDFPGFITILIRELIYEEKYSLINEIFNLKEMKFSNFNYTDIIFIGNSIGLLLRKKQEYIKLLQTNINFLNCVYLTFVDYSSLNSYYGNWTLNINESKSTKGIEIFSTALLKFRSFLNNTDIKEMDEKLIFSRELNPILYSRLVSTLFISNKDIDIPKVLTKYYSFHVKNKFSIDYFFELFTTSILLKNKEIMSYIMEKMELNIKFYYQKNHLNSYYLMSAFYHKLSNNEKEAQKVFKEFNLNEFISSYRDYIKLLYLIYVFDDTNEMKKKHVIKNEYLKISRKLNYPFFSEDYLINYFTSNYIENN
ncbi:hypothetical protein N9651_04030 [Flavobacteriales bacterium]|nr:hypothetical protein [Flavobacteriales bacterium]